VSFKFWVDLIIIQHVCNKHLLNDEQSDRHFPVPGRAEKEPNTCKKEKYYGKVEVGAANITYCKILDTGFHQAGFPGDDGRIGWVNRYR
jgi:hypothetical protein